MRVRMLSPIGSCINYGGIKGMSPRQAEAVMLVLTDVITESLAAMTRNTVTKMDQEKVSSDKRVCEITALKNNSTCSSTRPISQSSGTNSR